MLNITNDYLIFDNKETITFQNKDDDILTVANAVRRRSIMNIVDQGEAVVFSADMRFIVFKPEFDIALDAITAPDGSLMHDSGTGDYIRISSFDWKPKVNAIITDSFGKRYAVDRIFDDALRSRWVFDCSSLSGENTN